MKKNILFDWLFTVFLILTVMTYFGCEKKAERTEESKSEVKTEEGTKDTSSGIKKPIAKETVAVPDLKGTWTGTLDKRTTTLKITEQTDSSFSGKITINYRQVINQDVKGSFSPATMKVSMKDQLHSRYQGKYNGKLSKDEKNFSGTFTMDLDGSKFSFNLNKK
jgi:hypothetical protein